jgi:serine/threonine protein phosphatase PrpC
VSGWASRIFKSQQRDEKSEPERLRFTWHGVTDRGRVRPQNEDAFSCVTSAAWSLFVVADGMGGHDAGEIASRIAVETVCREIGEGLKHLGRDLPGLIESAVQLANSRVNAEGASKGSNMGTTLSLALLTGTTAFVGSVGDSRVYWLEDSSLTQVTQDHSLVASLVTAGELTKEGARNHPRSNILYRTVGRPERIAVDTFQVPLRQGGVLMLCTDGLWGMVSDESMCQVLAAHDAAQSACEKLVWMANEQGGRDNITAVVVRVS